MKKLLAGLLLIAATYFACTYNVEIKVTEAGATATCQMGDPTCVP